MSSAKALVYKATNRHTATVILAHGLGDSGAGWSFLAEQWIRQKKFQEVKFVFPNAPMTPITINMGMRMPGWFDILSLSPGTQQEDEAGIVRSRDVFNSLINDEIANGIPANRIVIGGFSQGGAMSLLTGLTCKHKLGGIFSLSSWLLLQGKVKEMIAESSDANKDTKIFMGHGDLDQVVRYDWGKLSAEQIKEWGYNVDFRTYPGVPHSADEQELEDLESYLKAAIPPLGDEKPGSTEGNL